MSGGLLLVFLIGLLVGSFLNVLIDRIARNEKFVFGRSYCESCQHLLSWQDLIPLFSFIFLAGRCRYCRARIPLWLPVIELVTALVFVLVAWWFFELAWGLIFLGLIIASLLIVVFFTDLKYRLVYGIIIYPALLITLVYQIAIFGSWVGLISPLLASLATGLFFYLLYLLTKKRGLGFGDVQIGLLMGLLLGWPNIVVALYLAFLTGALTGIILIIAGRAKMKTAIAFGPFLVLATFIAWFAGGKLISLVTTCLFF